MGSNHKPNLTATGIQLKPIEAGVQRSLGGRKSVMPFSRDGSSETGSLIEGKTGSSTKLEINENSKV